MVKDKQIRTLHGIESGINKNLFFVCSIVTVAVMSLTVVDFFSRGSFVPANINFFYLAVLLIYSLHKELLRWVGEKKGKREGEIFVYLWVILTTILYVVNFFSHDYYSFSREGYKLGTLRDVSILAVEVLGVFFFTRLLKLLEVLRHNQGKKQNL